jgi:hypothetical protein
MRYILALSVNVHRYIGDIWIMDYQVLHTCIHMYICRYIEVDTTKIIT